MSQDSKAQQQKRRGRRRRGTQRITLDVTPTERTRLDRFVESRGLRSRAAGLRVLLDDVEREKAPA